MLSIERSLPLVSAGGDCDSYQVFQEHEVYFYNILKVIDGVEFELTNDLNYVLTSWLRILKT